MNQFNKQPELIKMIPQQQELKWPQLLDFCLACSPVRCKAELIDVINSKLRALINFYELVILLVDDTGQGFFKFGHLTGFGEDRNHGLDENLPIEYHNDFKKVITSSQTSAIKWNEPGDVHFLSRFFSLTQTDNRSVNSAPLKYKDETLGWLFFTTDHSDYPRDFQSDTISNIANQIAAAIANIKLQDAIRALEQNIAVILQETSLLKQQLAMDIPHLPEEATYTYSYDDIIGSGPVMKQVFNLISRVSDTLSSVLIMGETGTGKELIARAIHNNSSRRHKKMIKINCAALPPNLIESELFGHERGSFTGAIERRIGKFELAHNSTLFLDEIGELPLELQVKLLRALQEREIERIGGCTTIKTDVRIIAATNRDLFTEVQNGNFRSDLFFRLNIFPIIIPPLRERREDIPRLAIHFLQKYTPDKMKGELAFSSRVIKELMAYPWPGNVRELEHLIERTIVLNHGKVIKNISLPVVDDSDSLAGKYVKTINEVEREHILAVLKLCKGKVAGIGGAAEILKIPSTTLNSKIRRLKIKKEYKVQH